MRNCFRMAGVAGLVMMMSLTGATLAAASQGRGHAQKAAKPNQKHTKAEQKRDKAEQKRDKKAGKTEAKHQTDTEAIAVDRDGHARVIREYGRGGSLPPGLAKREALPPGLRAQLHERGALPPGLQKRLVPVPVSLDRRLPPVPAYYRRYFAGDDLLVVDSRTDHIVAIVRDVWR